MFAKRGIVRLAASGGWIVIGKRLRHSCDWLAVAWRLKVGCGRVEVPDGWRGVGKRLQDGWGNGCEKVVVEWRLVVSASGLGNGCIVAELALRLPRVGRMSVRGRRKGALPRATRLYNARQMDFHPRPWGVVRKSSPSCPRHLRPHGRGAASLPRLRNG